MISSYASILFAGPVVTADSLTTGESSWRIFLEKLWKSILHYNLNLNPLKTFLSRNHNRRPKLFFPTCKVSQCFFSILLRNVEGKGLLHLVPAFTHTSCAVGHILGI